MANGSSATSDCPPNQLLLFAKKRFTIGTQNNTHFIRIPRSRLTLPLNVFFSVIRDFFFCSYSISLFILGFTIFVCSVSYILKVFHLPLIFI